MSELKFIQIKMPDLNALFTRLYGETEPGHCVKCKQPYSDANVFTEAGWRETKLSGFCEACWDETFSEEEDS